MTTTSPGMAPSEPPGVRAVGDVVGVDGHDVAGVHDEVGRVGVEERHRRRPRRGRRGEPTGGCRSTGRCGPRAVTAPMWHRAVTLAARAATATGPGHAVAPCGGVGKWAAGEVVHRAWEEIQELGAIGPRHPAGRALRSVRRRQRHLLPATALVNERYIHIGAGHDDRPPGVAVGGHGARAGVRHRSRRAHRRPLPDRPGQRHRRPPVDRDRRRRVDRPPRVHHRPEPRLRGPRRGRSRCR